MKSIRYICRLNCYSWMYCLRTSGSELVWDLGFELGSPVDMVLGVYVRSPLRYSINMLFGLEFFNCLCTSEESLVRFLLVPLSGLMISIIEILTGLPLVYSLEYTNPGYYLPGMLLGAPLRFWFLSAVVWGGRG